MIHFEPVHTTPYFGRGQDGDLVLTPGLREGLMNNFAKNMNCPVCGKDFAIYSVNHVYKIRKPGAIKTEYVCSWSCMRKYERERQTPKRGSRLNWSRSVESALERRELCLSKIEFYKARQKETTGYAHDKATQQVYQWRHNLKDVEEYLKLKGVTA